MSNHQQRLMKRAATTAALALCAGFALAVGAAAGGGGTDVRVNDPSLDPPGAVQNETALAVHGQTICAGFNDLVPGGVTGFARSSDLGTSWTDNGSTGQGSDPSIAVHEASGTFYYAAIANIGGLSAIGVANSTDDCQTLSSFVSATPASSTQGDIEDKPWIAVDSTGGPRDGNVYVCWDHFHNYPSLDSDIRFSASLDGGTSFVREQVISPANAVYPFGCHIDVGPGGEVYVTWTSVAPGDFSINFRRSRDGGQSWDPPVRVNSQPTRHPGIDRVTACGPEIRPTLNGDIRMLHGTWMAVDTTGGPLDGNIYVVWAHDPLGATDNSDVFFSTSRNAGSSWSPQLQVAGGTLTDQFEPFVEVGGEGTVSIAWYDRRDDAANNLDINVYATFSRDGGGTLDPLTRLSDVSFPPIVVPYCYMGEYIAVAGDADNFYYAWGDNRDGDPNVYFDLATAPALAPAPPGDVDCDRNIGAIDALLVLQRVAALLNSLDCEANADVGGTPGVDSVDALLILQYTAGLISSLPP